MALNIRERQIAALKHMLNLNAAVKSKANEPVWKVSHLGITVKIELLAPESADAFGSSLDLIMFDVNSEIYRESSC